MRCSHSTGSSAKAAPPSDSSTAAHAAGEGLTIPRRICAPACFGFWFGITQGRRVVCRAGIAAHDGRKSIPADERPGELAVRNHVVGELGGGNDGRCVDEGGYGVARRFARVENHGTRRRSCVVGQQRLIRYLLGAKPENGKRRNAGGNSNAANGLTPSRHPTPSGEAGWEPCCRAGGTLRGRGFRSEHGGDTLRHFVVEPQAMLCAHCRIDERVPPP